LLRHKTEGLRNNVSMKFKTWELIPKQPIQKINKAVALRRK
jgi:hypothetical protein